MMNGDHGERIAKLERDLQRMALDIGRYNARDAFTAGRVTMRLAKIASTGDPGDNVYDIIFRDGKYTETAGEQTVDWTDRQADAGTVVYNLSEDQPALNQVVPVFRWSGRWWTNAVKSSALIIATADADIEHAATGTCSDGVDDYEVYNARDKIWSGASVAFLWSNNEARYQAVHAWSATRIRGTVSGSTITAGGTGTLASVVPLNGHFTPTTVSSVRMPTTNQTAATGLKAWAELVWTGSASEWQIYQVDCPGA